MVRKACSKYLDQILMERLISLKCLIWTTWARFKIDLSHQFAFVLSALKNEINVKRNLEWARSSYAMDDRFSYLTHLSPVSHFYTP